MLGLAGAAAWAQTNTFPSSGNVGIGTINPTATLQVNGSVEMSGGAYLTDLSHQGSYIDAGNSFFRAASTSYTTPWSATSVGSTYGIVYDDTTNQWEYAVGSGNTYGGALLFDQTQGAFYLYNTGTNSGANGVSAQSVLTIRLTVNNAGNVGIGTTDPTQKLSVAGTVQAYAVTVQNNWSDYVFEPGYKLPSLTSVEKTIKTEHHLPGIPSAKEVAAKGINLGDMQAKLLAQIEELTLRQIEQENAIEQLQKENRQLRALLETSQ